MGRAVMPVLHFSFTMLFYSRHLPHWQPNQAEFFITFRLAGSLPKEAIEKLKGYRALLKDKGDSAVKDRIRKGIFRKYEQLLNSTENGPTWLRNDKIASIVKKSIHFHDVSKYDLYAYCIMPNHVHMVFRHMKKGADKQRGNEYPVTKILPSIKSFTALECNKLLNRKGTL